MEDYRVQLDVYNGPLDLLLYLIRREEVDVYDIPIARITGQYLEYVNLLQALDPNLAGEFLVLATQLMEIKTRMLLPRPETAEGEEGADDLDPRAELVRQLLEYKAFKDAAGELEDAAGEQSMRFPRAPAPLPEPDEAEVELEDVQVWSLFDAFSRLMESIGHRPTHHEVIYDDTPIELHAADIVDRLRREGAMTFSRIFAGRTSRGEIVGLFLALLELVRQRKIRASQESDFDEIRIDLAPDADAAGEEDEPDAESAPAVGTADAAADAGGGASGRVTVHDDELAEGEQTSARGEDAGRAEEGSYVSEPARRPESGGDAGEPD